MEKLIDVIKSRRSIRKYLDKPVKRELIDEIISVAITAPTAANKQPWKLIIINNPKKYFKDILRQKWALDRLRGKLSPCQ